MFGIGFFELIVILIVALIVLGPEGLPKAARMLGQFFNEMRRTTEEIKTEFISSQQHAEYQKEEQETDLKLDQEAESNANSENTENE